MIREYAPVGLIPAAWAMTFVTMIEPGIDIYWIRHMHYFMVLFLTGFTVFSWNRMSNNSVLNIWKNVIALGTVFTFAGALSFSLSEYQTVLSTLSSRVLADRTQYRRIFILKVYGQVCQGVQRYRSIRFAMLGADNSWSNYGIRSGFRNWLRCCGAVADL